jgi:glycosyltransferase involved in cell wall biosynthesis
MKRLLQATTLEERDWQERKINWRTRVAKIDVVITCYNYGRFLTQCVQSVLQQTGVDVGVVVVNDASTDNSAEIAAALAERDSRVKVISLVENVGVIRAVNRGLHETTGEYLVKLDADDLLAPGSLERSVALLERHPDVGFVYGRPRLFTGKVPQPRPGRPRWSIWSGAEWIALRCQRGFNCICQPEVLIRRSTLQAVGEFNVALAHTYDFEMWLRLAAVSNVGRINGVDQGYYRVHPDSQQHTVNAGILIDIVGRRDAFLSVLSSMEDRLPEAPQLEATVRRRLAQEALDRVCMAYDRDRVDLVLEDKLVDFAFTTFPKAPELPQWRSVQRRRQRGRRSRWTFSSLAGAVLRRGRREIYYRRWLRTGV